jgi:hypothetical protein
VTPAKIARYEQYNERHGAKYVPLGQQDGAAMDEDGWCHGKRSGGGRPCWMQARDKRTSSTNADN